MSWDSIHINKDTSGLYITTDLALEDETPSTLLPEKDTEPTDPAHNLVSDFHSRNFRFPNTGAVRKCNKKINTFSVLVNTRTVIQPIVCVIVCMFAQHNISRSHLQIINNVTKQLHLYAT